MFNTGRGIIMELLIILMYFTVHLIRTNNAWDVCRVDELNATSDLQSIFSSNFPSNYPNNVHCITHITSPEHTVIELTFYHFQLEYSEQCTKDALSITDGTSNILLYPDCGGQFVWPLYPDKIVSSSNDMTITFATDDQGNNRGFNATFRAVQPSPHYFIMAENSTIRVVPRFNAAHFGISSVTFMDPLAVDYDPRTQYVYYSDRGAKIIGRILTKPSRLQAVLHSEYIMEPFGLRIDVNSRLLYWTDAELGIISVSNMDGEYRNTIIRTDLDKPGAIVTESYKGYIYFTDWGTHPKIERSDGDGRNRLVLVNSTIVSPRSLAIDLKERTLYWVDAVLQSLERVNYDGTDRSILTFVSPSNVFSLVLDDNAFFCNGMYPYDPSLEIIHVFDRKLQSEGSYVGWGSESYYKGISLRPRHEEDFAVDTCPKADCNWLCLPKPNGQHTCLSGDTTAPVFLGCPLNITVWVAPGVSSSSVLWDDISLADDVDFISSASHSSGSTFHLGSETVAIAARDFLGNMAWCNFTVTVSEDLNPPVITFCPNDIVVNLSSSVETGRVVMWDEPLLWDNAGRAHWLEEPSFSGTVFPIGSTRITYVASDQFGNQAECFFTVTVSAIPQPTSPTDGHSQNHIQIAYLVAGFGSLLGLLGLVGVVLVCYTLCKRQKRKSGNTNDQITLNSTGTDVKLNDHLVLVPASMIKSSNPCVVTTHTIAGASVQYTKPENEPYYMDSLNTK